MAFDDFDAQLHSDEREECGECGRPVGIGLCFCQAEDVPEYDEDEDGEPLGSHDLSDDADALASAGWGTDEDYGYFGSEDFF